MGALSHCYLCAFMLPIIITFICTMRHFIIFSVLYYSKYYSHYLSSSTVITYYNVSNNKLRNYKM